MKRHPNSFGGKCKYKPKDDRLKLRNKFSIETMEKIKQLSANSSEPPENTL